MSVDPHAFHHDRQSRHEDKRVFLESFLDSVSLDLHPPDETGGFPPALWAEVCLSSPVTRVPAASQEGLPSTLDYAASSRGFLNQISAFWLPLPTDHSALFITCYVRCQISQTFTPSTWKCSDNELALDWLRQRTEHCEANVASCISLLRDVQRAFEKRVPSHLARSCREPLNIKELRARLRACTEPSIQKQFSKDIFKSRIAYLKERKAQHQQAQFTSGRPVWRRKKL